MKNERKHNKDFFKKLKEESYKRYSSIPPLNWGETINGEYVTSDRYFLQWNKIDKKNNLYALDKNITSYILEYNKKTDKKGKKLTVFIGVDSQNSLLKTVFIVSVVLYTNQNGGHEIISKSKLPKIYDYRYRLLKEADFLGEVARNICPFLSEHNIPFELHLDYNSNTNHKSNGVVVEATNYLKHLGYKFEIKPKAWAASVAADYFCR